MVAEVEPSGPRSAPSPGPGTLALPSRPARGPVTRARLRRFLGAVALVEVAATAAAVLLEDGGWRAFALGVVLPGAGFGYGVAGVPAAVALVAVTALAWAVALVAWVGVGAWPAPVAVWLGSAGLAGLTAGPEFHPAVVPAAPAVAALLAGALLWRDVASRRAAVARAAERDTYLATLPVPPPRTARPATAELSEVDLGHLRWLLDLALQPLDRFDGFDRLDQFGFTALRYQLNFTQYALAAAQRGHTPAFHGYLSAAQRNLIDKMTDRRVWRYWWLENLWGNLDPDPDPIRRDNIMFSGYLGLMLTLYRNASGDPHYDAPGSLVFRTRRGREFRYDHPAITAAVARQFAEAPSGMWPCEPGFAYPMCNSIAANGVLGADPGHGRTLGPGVLEALRRGFAEEYTAADGSLVHVRSTRYGFATPGLGTGTVLGAWQRANMPLLMRAVDPVTAQRHWEILRREDARLVDGEFTLPRVNLSDRRDAGNLRRSPASFWAWLYADAREFGDHELADAALRTAELDLEPRTRDGARAYARASVHSNAVFALGRFVGEYGFTDAVTAPLPPAWREGPLLSSAPYPACLVARAESDRHGLRLVLRPGAAAGRVELALARLTPHAAYSVRGAVPERLVAAADGTAALPVDLHGRTEVEIRPA